jgi:hypothetical protein
MGRGLPGRRTGKMESEPGNDFVVIGKRRKRFDHEVEKVKEVKKKGKSGKEMIFS